VRADPELSIMHLIGERANADVAALDSVAFAET
jgi:hypothetical protein